MFVFHMAFALGLIALAAGTALFSCSGKDNSCCPVLTRLIGFLIIVCSLVVTVCTGYCGVMMYRSGIFQQQMQQMQHMMQTQDNSATSNEKATPATTTSTTKTHRK